MHVSRSGTHTGQNHRLPRRRERHSRTAHRADLARPRHSAALGRERQGESYQSHMRDRIGGGDGRPCATAAAMIDPLPPLREVIARHGLQARKSLGQNFLLDLNLTRRIARAAGPLEDYSVVEVGPGPGGLTRALLNEGAENVVAIERDRRAIPALDEIAAAFPNR